MEPMTGTEASPEELKKALEWELSLDNSDLRSHAWYHGTIPRQRAEELMSEEGDFLIRDCISRPGDYVLTCRWRGAPLHFVINKVVFQPFTVYEKIQYQFEDDCFDTVPDLVTYYVGNKRPISAASGAIVSKPVNRSMPLSYYASRYGLQCQMHYAALALEKVAGQDGGSPVSKSARGSKESTPERRLSQPPEIPPKMIEENLPEPHPSGASTIPRCATQAATDYSTKIASSSAVSSFATLRSHHAAYPYSGSKIRVASDLAMSPSMERRAFDPRPQSGHTEISTNAEINSTEDQPPPKPSRVPSKRYAGTGPGKDSVVIPAKPDATSVIGDSSLGPHVYSELTYPEKNCPKLIVPPASETTVRIPDSTSVSDLKKSLTEQDSLHEGSNGEMMDSKVMTVPDLEPPSAFDLSTFATVLLPPENKPLDPPALARMRCMLLENGPRVIASHLTKVDLDVLRVSGKDDLGLGVITGFELLLLPQGQQMRLDLLERTESLKFFVAITILTCGDEDVRASVLNKWIQVAIETKTALGNLYGFTGIMQGLALAQISRLRSTWLKLRQTFTENALTYETKLRPTLKNMQECSNPQAPNTCIPYLLSLVIILQRHVEAIISTDEHVNDDQSLTTVDGNKEKSKYISLGLPWEQTSADYGLQLLLTHLEIGRSITQQWPTYRRNSEIVLENVKYDDLMLDMFRTEFHLKFLWGSKGSHVTAKERYSKFLQVLDVMSERCEAS